MVPCPQLWEVLYVGHDGRVSACCRDYHGQLVVGDIAEQSLRDIWHGPTLSDLRAKHLAGDLDSLPEACRACLYTGSARADLLCYMIGAVRRSEPGISAEAFTRHISDFVAKLSQTL
jgi:radical SAM protein with 4Fe4S-binding SPASM domain